MKNKEIYIRPLSIVAFVSGMTSFIYLIIYIFKTDVELAKLANITFPTILVLVSLWAGYKLLQKSPMMIWSPIPWFLGTCALYYGFGPLVYYFGTPESIWVLDTYYPANDGTILRSNMLNSIAITTVILAFMISKILLSNKMKVTSQNINIKATKKILIFFLTIGVPVKYLLALPNQFRLLDWVLPGSIQYLSIFTSLSIIVLFVLIHEGQRQYRPLLFILIASELIVGLMTLSKMEMIITALMILLGTFITKPRMRILIPGTIIVILLYLLLSPFVMYARLAFKTSGIDNVGDLMKGVQEYSQSDRNDVVSMLMPGVQGWWTRLSYANAQNFVMDSYNNGTPGDSFSLVIYSIVPRILFPDKPIISSLGRDFHEMVTGIETEGTHSGPGVFAEAYWNGGWLLVIFTCIFVGVVFSLFTISSIYYLGNGNLAFLPIAFSGLMLGLRPDDWFVISYVGVILQSVVIYLILRLLGFFDNKVVIEAT